MTTRRAGSGAVGFAEPDAALRRRSYSGSANPTAPEPALRVVIAEDEALIRLDLREMLARRGLRRGR